MCAGFGENGVAFVVSPERLAWCRARCPTPVPADIDRPARSGIRGPTGGGGSMKRLSSMVIAGALMLGSACSNLSGPPTTELASTTSDEGINCQVTVGSGDMNCGTPTAARGLALNV